jgi:hypothetical protein
VKLDLAGGDVDISNTACGISHSNERMSHDPRKFIVMEVFVTAVSCGVSIKHAQLAT